MMRRIPRITFLLIFAVLASAAASQIRSFHPQPENRTEFELPVYQHFNNTGLSILAISPDGKQFAYCTTSGIYVCSGNPMTTRLLRGTQGSPVQPFFSPDSKWLGFISERDGKLKKVSLETGEVILLRNAGAVSGAHWFTNDSIVYSRNGRSIVQISANGRNAKVLVDAVGELAIYPQILPGGDSLLYTATTTGNAAESRIMVRSLKSGQEKTVWTGAKGQYLADGRLIYKLADKSIRAIPFDLHKLEVAGPPETVLRSIWDNGSLQYAASGNGTFVYIPEDATSLPTRTSTLSWLTREGKIEPLGITPDRYSHVKISPDAAHIALTVDNGKSGGIWIWDCARKSLSRLTSEANPGNPLWTFDGRHVVYHFAPDKTNYDIVRKLWDGTGNLERLLTIPQKPYLFYTARSDKELTLLSIPGADPGSLPQISPDGQWIAYSSDDTGRKEIYVSPFPEITREKFVISVAGGTNPLWSPDGKEIFYRQAEAIIAIPVETSPAMRTGKALPLFWMPESASSDDGGAAMDWDISPDGKRFLMIHPVEKYHRIVRVNVER